MNKILCFLFILFLFACESNKTRYENPNLPIYQVNETVNLALPQFNNLNFANNPVTIDRGIRGIVIMNVGNGSYVAYDLACPNVPYQSCAKPMTIESLAANCECDNTKYDLFTGQSPGQLYTMKQYIVDVSRNILYIHN